MISLITSSTTDPRPPWYNWNIVESENTPSWY